MIDIQIPLSCSETFGYTPLGDLPAFEYNAEKDITKYGTTLAQTYVTLARSDGNLLPAGWACTLYLGS